MGRDGQRDQEAGGQAKQRGGVGAKGGPNRRSRPVQASGPVRFVRSKEQLELHFEGRFTQRDLEVVKGIPGREYSRSRKVWLLPFGEEALGTLQAAFGPRLVTDDGAALPLRQDQPAGRTASEMEAEIEGTLHRLSRVLRIRGYSPRTVKAYVDWSRRFLRFQAGRVDRLEILNGSHAEGFIEHLAIEKRLSANSRNLAASAMAFLFREILGRDEMAEVPRARGPKRLPVVLSHREVLLVLGHLEGKYFLIVVLMYSAGLRLEECLQLRIKDIDFGLRQILVRGGKGDKDRYVPLAKRAAALLRLQIREVEKQHARDLAEGHGWAQLPGALHGKDPQAGFELGWQFLSPASTITRDPVTSRTGRWRLHHTAVQRTVKAAVRASPVRKRASCHTFRHSFATEALRGGCDIRTLQRIMGHKDIRTTMIYLHVLEHSGLSIQSPLDRPDDPDAPGDGPDGFPWTSGLEDELDWDLARRQWRTGR